MTVTKSAQSTIDAGVESAAKVVDASAARAAKVVDATTERVTKVVDATTERVTKAVDESAERAQNFNEKVYAAAKQASLLTLDSYEKSLGTVTEFQKKLAGASGLDWVGAVVNAQADLVSGLTATATSAAREMLK